MIMDIDETATKSSVRSFADDTRVCKAVKNVFDCTCLQIDLNSIYEWAEENKMVFHNDKFELLRIRIPCNPIQDCASYISPSGHVISERTCVKDLGVLVSNDLSFKDHIQKVVTAMRNLSAWILRTFQSREKYVMLTMWKTLVLPIHDYCSQLWSPNFIRDKEALETVQWSFLRKIKSLKATTP